MGRTVPGISTILKPFCLKSRHCLTTGQEGVSRKENELVTETPLVRTREGTE